MMGDQLIFRQRFGKGGRRGEIEGGRDGMEGEAIFRLTS
jgi:hypothetical protein